MTLKDKRKLERSVGEAQKFWAPPGVCRAAKKNRRAGDGAPRTLVVSLFFGRKGGTEGSEAEALLRGGMVAEALSTREARRSGC